jgi:hypothetical protein
VAEVRVERTEEDDDGFRFRVSVEEAGSSTEHDVSLTRRYYEEAGGGAESPSRFVERCFGYLLEREPKESILRRFDVRDIGSYFPGFEEEIRG